MFSQNDQYTKVPFIKNPKSAKSIQNNAIHQYTDLSTLKSKANAPFVKLPPIAPKKVAVGSTHKKITKTVGDEPQGYNVLPFSNIDLDEEHRYTMLMQKFVTQTGRIDELENRIQQLEIEKAVIEEARNKCINHLAMYQQFEMENKTILKNVDAPTRPRTSSNRISMKNITKRASKKNMILNENIIDMPYSNWSDDLKEEWSKLMKKAHKITQKLDQYHKAFNGDISTNLILNAEPSAYKNADKWLTARLKEMDYYQLNIFYQIIENALNFYDDKSIHKFIKEVNEGPFKPLFESVDNLEYI